MLTASTHTPSHRGNADGRGKFNLSWFERHMTGMRHYRTCATTKRSRLSALAVEFELFHVRPLPAASYCGFTDIQHQGRQTRRRHRGVNKCNRPENENGGAGEHSGQLFHRSDQLLLHLRRVREESKQDSPSSQVRSVASPTNTSLCSDTPASCFHPPVFDSVFCGCRFEEQLLCRLKRVSHGQTNDKFLTRL